MKRNFRISQAGQGLVEFALLLPVMVLFLMVIFDLGRAAYYYSAIHNAAREGARYGAVRWYDLDVSTKTREAVKRLTAGLNEDDISISTNYFDQDGDGENDIVRVIVTYRFKPATPILVKVLGPSGSEWLELPSQAIMRMER